MDMLKSKVKQAAFVTAVQKKALPRKPLKKKGIAATVYGMRAKRSRIYIAARDLLQMNILYRKINGEVKKYTVEPYSYRTKRLKMGWRKLLFAFDVNDDKENCKGFLLTNILSVEVLDKPYTKIRWLVELGDHDWVYA